jgi:AraC-like DNA-binding protein
VRHTLGSTSGKKTDIADLLGMYPRTLQRHLKAEGTTIRAGSVVVERTIGDYAHKFWRYLGGGDTFRRELDYRDDIAAA